MPEDVIVGFMKAICGPKAVLDHIVHPTTADI